MFVFLLPPYAIFILAAYITFQMSGKNTSSLGIQFEYDYLGPEIILQKWFQGQHCGLEVRAPSTNPDNWSIIPRTQVI